MGAEGLYGGIGRARRSGAKPGAFDANAYCGSPGAQASITGISRRK